ncbi:MAG: hypothetical protein JXR26_10710 [Balneolaceae bacterium]|nr:hypothetical protein [Balneolaceae bacterium]
MRKLIIVTLFVSICYACSTSKTPIKKASENQSHYHLQRLTGSQNMDSAMVTLKAFRTDDDITKQFGYFSVKVNNVKWYETKGDSMINLKLKPGKYYFFATSVGYDTVRTNRINLTSTDSLLIDFYLGIDFKPIE